MEAVTTTGEDDPVRILEDAARALREHYLHARAAVAEMELELSKLRVHPAGAERAETVLEREADLAEMRTGMRSLRERCEEMEHGRREAVSVLSAAGLRLQVQQLLSRAAPGRMADALDDARRQIALRAAEADAGGSGLKIPQPQTRARSFG